ncbi:MAG: exodeoxyribonuclease III [Nevskiales bacterium]
MRVITFNCNGIRSAAKKGFFDWLAVQNADFLCLQETKAQLADIERTAACYPAGWTAFFNSAQKKGYAGVGLYAREKPDAVLTELGHPEFDAEGRYLELRYGKFSVVSLYLPSGSAGPHRQASKDRFLEFFMPKLRQWAKSGREYLICGDWNIAHKEQDLKNWKSNQKNSGFLPHERAWMDVVFGQAGWMDAYRVLHPDTTDACYTWWSNRGQARAKNVGWRIDYQVINPSFKDRLRRAAIFKKQWYSDHAPLTLDYDGKF